MDVDGSGVNSQQTDLEQSLLQEFSRMGTRDKDELVNQMQKLLGSSLNYNTASFFLDMNNWNLQEAACCYLDMQPPALSSAIVPRPVPFTLDMSIVQCPDPLVRPPGVESEWQIVLRNSGVANWPEGCCVRPVGASGAAAPTPVAALQEGDAFQLTLPFLSPSTPGEHRQLYRLYTPQGEAFGDELWVNITVQDDQQLQQIVDASTDDNMC